MAYSSRSIADPGPNQDCVSSSFEASSPPRVILKNKVDPLSRSPGRSPSRIYGPISAQSSPYPPPPVSQPRRHADANPVILERDMMESFGHPSPKTTTHRPMVSQFSQPSSHLSTIAPVLPPSSSSAPGPVPTPTSRASTPLPPMVRGFAFVLLRILLFPKTIFVRGVVVGRGCLNRLGFTPIHRGTGNRRPHRHFHPHHQGRQRHHYRSYQQSSGGGPEVGGSVDQLSSYRTRQQQHRRHSHPASTSRSRSRSRGDDYPRLSTGSGRGNGNGGEGGAVSKDRGSCWSWFKNHYNVQVAMICLCLTGESFAQSVMCPFLYYMVRDFHVGPDIWIGYYAGLLWTGFWGANLCTTLLWGHLSDKYGRKTILLFGLFTTSMSTLGLGLSTCYHDAMWALVIQGACTGLVPVSKCSIGELANRQQHIHDTERALAKAQMDGQLFDLEEVLHEKSLDVEGIEELEIENGVWCSDPDCSEGIDAADLKQDPKVAPLVKARVDYAAKGYSVLVIALALGAALGPLAGGSLARKHIHGFDSYPYFAPCLLATAVGIFITGVVALLLNETNPKWSKPTEYENLLEVRTKAASMYLHENLTPPITRGRSGYEQSRRHKEAAGVASGAAAESSLDDGSTCEDKTDLGEAEVKTPSSNETRSRLRAQGGTSMPSADCTCPPTASSRATPKVLPTRSMLSPATELYLILAIYTLLVLTSIIGSEFIMLYTQSPVLRGGLEFSAKVLGQVLTMRGILKLIFNLFGYPWMVKRVGLLNCLRLGIIAIGSVSVLGLGWFVPWSVENENMALAVHAGDEDSSQATGGSTERPPVGMTAILLCLSLISVGDVLGYISVLVLFGKSADRLKGANKTVNTEGRYQQQGGSGVLWSVAQVSANVMRLTGPVLAGLLWSLTDKSPSVSVSDIERVGPSIVGSSGKGSTQSTFSAPVGSMVEKVEFQESHGQFWAVAAKILRGSTSVFYLVGAICIVNFVASQILYLSTPSSYKVEEAGSLESQQQHQHEPAPQVQDYFLQPGYSSGLSQQQQPQLGQLEAAHGTCLVHPPIHPGT